MGVRVIRAADLWDAEAYWQDGNTPWTIFAYPASLADEQRLPYDDDARRFLVELQTNGIRVGVWAYPSIRNTIYFACPYEDKDRVDLVIKEFERLGIFPVGFAKDRAEHLFSLAAASTQQFYGLPREADAP